MVFDIQIETCWDLEFLFLKFCKIDTTILKSFSSIYLEAVFNIKRKNKNQFQIV
jgi:hypothetical protein